MKYTVSDAQYSLDIASDSPEAAAQVYADGFDWTGFMTAFRRAKVSIGETVLGEFTYGRYAPVEYTALITPFIAEWNVELGRYELPCQDNIHNGQTYISANGDNWDLAGPDGVPRGEVDADPFLRAGNQILLVGGPKDGILVA